MTTDEKLTAILAAVQTDPGNRGLARDPHDNLFTATAGQFQAACRSIAEHPDPQVRVYTGFYIPNATPPAFETDGPLGAAFLRLVLFRLNVATEIRGEWQIVMVTLSSKLLSNITHLIALERPGPTADGSFRTMRGNDITEYHHEAHTRYVSDSRVSGVVTIGIGDGGNEIGMGKLSSEILACNIPNGPLVHCRVPTNHLVVAGVSNWGAYALAAGVSIIRGRGAAVADLFSPKQEFKTLQNMVNCGPLVDGVTGRQEATVDGLPWDVYAAPLLRIREILELP